jgi:hypothetical protein
VQARLGGAAFAGTTLVAGLPSPAAAAPKPPFVGWELLHARVDPGHAGLGHAPRSNPGLLTSARYRPFGRTGSRLYPLQCPCASPNTLVAAQTAQAAVVPARAFGFPLFAGVGKTPYGARRSCEKMCLPDVCNDRPTPRAPDPNRPISHFRRRESRLTALLSLRPTVSAAPTPPSSISVLALGGRFVRRGVAHRSYRRLLREAASDAPRHGVFSACRGRARRL